MLDRFVAEAPDCYPRTNLCAGELVPWGEGVWRRRLGLECRSPGVLEIAPGMLRNESLIEIPVAGAYRITASASSTPTVNAEGAVRAAHPLSSFVSRQEIGVGLGSVLEPAGKRSHDFQEAQGRRKDVIVKPRRRAETC